MKCNWIQGKKEADDIGFFMLTAKAEYLFMVTYYYSILVKDDERIKLAVEEFNRYSTFKNSFI